MEDSLVYWRTVITHSVLNVLEDGVQPMTREPPKTISAPVLFAEETVTW